jgi:hypothetical protein
LSTAGRYCLPSEQSFEQKRGTAALLKKKLNDVSEQLRNDADAFKSILGGSVQEEKESSVDSDESAGDCNELNDIEFDNNDLDDDDI